MYVPIKIKIGSQGRQYDVFVNSRCTINMPRPSLFKHWKLLQNPINSETFNGQVVFDMYIIGIQMKLDSRQVSTGFLSFVDISCTLI